VTGTQAIRVDSRSIQPIPKSVHPSSQCISVLYCLMWEDAESDKAQNS
jgi:hypothetical protein